MNIRTFLYSIIVLLVFLGGLTSCNKDSYVSDAQRLAAEETLYKKFLEQSFDTISASSLKTIGRKDTVDLVVWIKKNGLGVDTIASGQTVGYRYKLYSIYADSVGVIHKLLQINTFGDAYPSQLVVDEISSYSGQRVNLAGLDKAFKHLKKDGVAHVFMPSSLAISGYQDFYSRYYEIQVVYVSR